MMKLLLLISVFCFSTTLSLGQYLHTGCWSTTYGRGVGKVISTCSDGEEKNGALCYPKCKDGYYGVGPVCWQTCPKDYSDFGVGCSKPSSDSDCPAGFTDSGITCTKDSYGRGAGTPLKCASGLVEDDALCYKACGDSYNGVGPVCWHQCPSDFTTCGALCLSSPKECFKELLTIAEDVAAAAAEIASDPEDAVDALKKAIIKIGGDLKYPICPNIS